MAKIRGALELTGGGAGALDALDGDLLDDGDVAVVFVKGDAIYYYILDAASGEAEVVPQIIAPDINPGLKRWVLHHPGAGAGSMKPDGSNLAIGDDAEGDMYVRWNSRLARLPKGAPRYVVTMNPAGTVPIWDASPASMLTAEGDLLMAHAANAPGRLARGAALQLMQMNSGGTRPEYTSAPYGNAPHIVVSSSLTLLPGQVAGTIITNTGQANNLSLVLPPIVSGMNFVVALGTTVARFFRITPAGTDRILLSGTNLGAGRGIQVASAKLGDAISFFAFSNVNWYAAILNGSWVAV